MLLKKHYYHVFCGTEEVPSIRWPDIVQEHIAALEDTGLMGALDYIGVGIVGTPENRELVKAMLPSNFNIVAEEDFGWEQTTMRAMDLSEPAAILYCHTKGAAFPAVIQDRWRTSMINAVIYDWERCFDAVINEGFDTMGCFWRPAPWYHYSGTYWVARSDYLATLPPFNYESRWEAEAWIGKGTGIFGDIGPGHPATSKIERGWTYREGTVRTHSRMFGLKPGVTYRDIEVTRLMQKVSDRGCHLTVIESHPAVKKIEITKKDTRSGPPPR